MSAKQTSGLAYIGVKFLEILIGRTLRLDCRSTVSFNNNLFLLITNNKSITISPYVRLRFDLKSNQN